MADCDALFAYLIGTGGHIMEHLDGRIIDLITRGAQEQKKIKDWEEPLEAIIAEIRQLQVTQGGLDMAMKEYKLFDQRLTIFLPSNFIPMDTQHIKRKYPNESRPKMVFRNKKDTVNIGFTVIKESVPEEDLPGVRDIMKNAFLSVNPASTILDEGNFKQDENTVAYYTFPSFALGGQMYNLIFITLLGGGLLVCNLNCLKKDMETYQLLFYGIMKTVKAEKEQEMV